MEPSISNYVEHLDLKLVSTLTLLILFKRKLVK